VCQMAECVACTDGIFKKGVLSANNLGKQCAICVSRKVSVDMLKLRRSNSSPADSLLINSRASIHTSKAGENQIMQRFICFIAGTKKSGTKACSLTLIA